MHRAIFGLALLVSMAPAAWGQRRDVLTHGSWRLSGDFNPSWIAVVEGPTALEEKTTIIFREKFGQGDWQPFPELPTRVIGLASHGNELVVVLKNGTWAWFSPERYTIGPPLPRHMLLAMAGDMDSLWALGRLSKLAAGPAAPATAEAEGASARVSPDAPVLFSLSGQEWTSWEAAWPDEVASPGQEDVSLAIIGDVPHLAVLGRNEVRLYAFLRDAKQWERVGAQPASPGLGGYVKLINLSGRAGLWIPAQGGAGAIWTAERSMQLPLAGAPPEPRNSDLAVTGDQLRLVFRQEEKLFEQRYNLDGSADGAAAQIQWARPRGTPSIDLFTTTVMAVITILLISTLLRRRAAAREEDRTDNEE